jgi:hypothetical protein
MQPDEISPQEQLMKFILGKWISQPMLSLKGDKYATG